MTILLAAAIIYFVLGSLAGLVVWAACRLGAKP